MMHTSVFSSTYVNFSFDTRVSFNNWSNLQPGSDAQGAMVASMPAGSFVGALMVTKLADLVGRKMTIILSGILWIIGSTLQCAAQVSAFSKRESELQLISTSL